MLQASFVQKAQMRVDSCSQMLHANGTSVSPAAALRGRETAGAKAIDGSVALPDPPRGIPAPWPWPVPKHTVAGDRGCRCFPPRQYSACRPSEDFDIFEVLH